MRKSDFTLPKLDDLFTTQEMRDDAKLERVQNIPLSELHPFKNHPFKVQNNEEMERMIESIRKVGAITPALARPLPDGGYELISGHRRLAACQVLGIEKMPVIVREMSDDEAVIAMVDANLQRETILPSEKAFAYKMKLEAIKHQGMTSVQLGQKLLSRSSVAAAAKTSETQIQRYIEHDVAIDTAGTYLAALFVANILDTGSQKQCNETTILLQLIEHILGRKGENKQVSQADKMIVSALNKYIETNKIRGKNREQIIADTQYIVNTANETIFSGNIIDDWKQVVKIISTSQSDYYQRIIEDVKYLRLLQRGSQLYSALDSIWRQNNTYVGSLRAVSDALTHEHFSLSTRKWNGINIMTIHKSKGKEFDVVVVYDGRHQNKIMSSPERKEQAILNLRVAVTRAKQHTYIFTPEDDPCPLI